MEGLPRGLSAFADGKFGMVFDDARRSRYAHVGHVGN